MTALDKRKTKLIFETADTVQERSRLREVIIEAQPYYALVRLKGTRKAFPISYAAIYYTAAKIEARRKIEEKKTAAKDQYRKRRKP